MRAKWIMRKRKHTTGLLPTGIPSLRHTTYVLSGTHFSQLCRTFASEQCDVQIDETMTSCSKSFLFFIQVRMLRHNTSPRIRIWILAGKTLSFLVLYLSLLKRAKGDIASPDQGLMRSTRTHPSRDISAKHVHHSSTDTPRPVVAIFNLAS